LIGALKSECSSSWVTAYMFNTYSSI